MATTSPTPTAEPPHGLQAGTVYATFESLATEVHRLAANSRLPASIEARRLTGIPAKMPHCMRRNILKWPSLLLAVSTAGMAKIHSVGLGSSQVTSAHFRLETTEQELLDTIFPHPTVSEAMQESVMLAFDRPLHL